MPTKELYLAKNMEELNQKANEPIFKHVKLAQLYKVAQSVYHQLVQNMVDGEKTYIYAVRLLKVLDIIYMKDTDQRFVHTRYDSMRRHVEQIFNDLHNTLPLRYNLLAVKEQNDKDIPKVPVVKKDGKGRVDVFGKVPDIFISARHFYTALENVADDMLIIDVRSANYYNASKLNGQYNVINIDDRIVERGMSGAKLEEKLSEHTKDLFQKREQFNYIVMIDNDTVKDSFPVSKMKVLFDILTRWDVNKNYKHQPYIVNGGYVDFVDMYPTLCTNPHVICSHRYADLDDLLNLDTIEYPPIDMEEGYGASRGKEIKIHGELEKLYRQLIQHSERVREIEEQTLRKDQELLRMMKLEEITEHDIKEREQLKYEIEAIEMERVANNERKNELTIEFLTALTKNKVNEAEYLNRPELLLVEKAIVETSRRRRKVLEEMKKFHMSLEEENQNQGLLAPTSIEKPVEPVKKPLIPTEPVSGDSLYSKVVPLPEVAESSKKAPPTINRATKPLNPVATDTGLNGLVNIRNSCYMNSIIQCLRHIPYLRYFFISGDFKRHITTPKPQLMLEFGDLMQRLWFGNNCVIRPQEFYNKITDLFPDFGKGQHEDANEFYMIVFTFIHEDIMQKIEFQRYWPKQRDSFFRSLLEKSSFLVDQFYYQIETDSICPSCNKQEIKFETESMIILNPPLRGHTTLDDLVERALYSFDSANVYCQKCEQNPKISRKISLQPRILTVLLKRYYCENDALKKINTACEFPLDNFIVGNAKYKLWAICLHKGSMNAGHYTAVCLNVLDNKWYDFNDEIVRMVDFNQISYEKEVYMLFYQITDEKLVGFQ